MRARWGLGSLTVLVALGLAAHAALQDRTATAPLPAADEILLPAAPGALFGAQITGLAVAAGTQAVTRTYDVRRVAGYEGDPPSIEVLEIGDVGGEARVRVRLDARPAAIALDASGGRVAVVFDDHVAIHRTGDGGVELEFPLAGARELEFASDGTMAASIDGGVVMLAADGSERARHLLGGTAHDVMRVYGGDPDGPLHTTEPVDVAAQPVAMSYADDGRLAVSMTDGTVHVVDGMRVLHLGAAPDPGAPMADYPWVVTPLDVSWSRGAVLAVVGSGALLRFETSGMVGVVHDGRCASAETETMLDAFPGDRSESTVRHYCERAGGALFSAGRVLHFASMGVRVRSARTGAGVGAFETLDHGPMALDGDARIVMSNAEGLLRVHALPSGRVSATEPRLGAAGTVSLHAERDLVVVSVGPTLPSDAEEERPWTTQAFHLDGTPRPGLDLRGVTFAVARDADRIAIVTHEPFGVRLTDLDGHTIRDVGASLPAGEYFAIELAHDGRSMVVDRDGALHVIRDDGTTRLLGTGNVVTAMELDDAAARAAVVRFDATSFTYAAEVVEIATGRVLFATPCGSQLTISPDGARVAYHEPGTSDLVVRGVGSGAELARLPSDGMGASGLHLAPDGSLYFSRTIEGLTRWAYPAAPVALGLGALGPESIRFGASTIVVEDAHFGAHVLRSSDGVHLASVHALVTGGFVALSRSGAFDGSTDAAGAFFAVRGALVTRGLDDASVTHFRAPGLLARALGGADVGLP